MLGKECPCRGCTERMLLCHGRCERYQSWKTEYENAREAQQAVVPELPRNALQHIWRMMKEGRRRK